MKRAFRNGPRMRRRKQWWHNPEYASNDRQPVGRYRDKAPTTGAHGIIPDVTGGTNGPHQIFGYRYDAQ
jgi:hypothetical protein